ncbi:Mucin-3A [Heterocephalus glaber]|uniref:Mucin-3A n=1 Tax=Heterocephalus glaber TaxID=10181 RepID=G5AV53_HETGA|nr:Mucin-3A [Heterocephalus glaber]
MVTIPSSPSERTIFPTYVDTTTSRTPETEPAHITTGAPSSPSAGTVPMNTALTSGQTPSENWLSSKSVTTPSMAGSTVKPSSNLPTVTTSSKLTHPTPPTTWSPGTPVATTQTPTTITSPRTASTPTRMTTVSRLTTTLGTCENGGTWEQGHCTCPQGFFGDRCEHLDKCQNGGMWDGLKCICPSTFYGSFCETPVEQIEVDTVEAEVGMEVSVDQEFSADLKDNTSMAYRGFSNLFQNQMKKIYKTVAGFQDVEILSLRNGSIVVDYLVLLKLPFSSQLESDYEKVKTALKEELQNVSQRGDSCQDNQTLCFKPGSIKVNSTIRTELNLQAICHRAAPKGYEEFYFPLVEGNRFRCVTSCAPDVDGALDCNQGQCFLGKSGPACRCFSTDKYWFSGPRCEVAVHWRALVGGLAGAGALLLLLLLGVLSWVTRSRRKDRRSRAEDREWFEAWDDDTVGTFANMGFEDDRTVKDANFQVVLQTVDPSVQMDEVYTGHDLPAYRRVIIRNLTEGSIVVQNDVVLETNYIPQYKELFKNFTKIVRDKIKMETSIIPPDQDKCPVSILCYNINDTAVDEAGVRMNFDPQEQCTQKSADGYSQFYYVEELNGQLTCVTRCTPGSQEYLSCNLGECQLQRSGPHCLCPNTDSHWYWGETCELNISKNLVYGLVGTLLALLLVIMLILAIFLTRSRRREHSQEYTLSQEWQKEGIPGSFQNMGVWEDQNLKDKFGLENAYSRFHPSLGTVNPTTEVTQLRPSPMPALSPGAPLSSPGAAPQLWGHPFSLAFPSPQLHFQRPEVVRMTR